uniref:TBC1 domain family member 10A n=1 Tax=Oryctolagus cuniculus TaxID=9986 RepID=G1STG6_RABIT
MSAAYGRGVGGVGGGREAEAAEVAEVAAGARAAGAAGMAKSSGENGPRAPAAAGSLSGTRESLAQGPDAAAADELSSLGSDSEANGFAERRIDKFGFIVGSQGVEGALEEVPLEVLRQRESKWLDMLNNWDKWMAKKHKKIRLRCQKGIPPSLRGRAWQYLSGGKVKLQQNPGKFDELDMSPGDPKWLDVIERDLHRQFPFHEMFVSRGGHGQQDLFRVLKAYTLYRPEEGYCQAQAPIAAVLLMHMPAEQAFWCLVQICEKYLPGYYSEKLEAIQLDGEILFSLLQKVSPVAHKHLSRQKIDPLLYMTEWFMCAFARTLPWSSVLRVWDMFFCEGVKIIFRVGLVLLKHALGSPEKLKACQGQYETIERLRSLSPKIMQEAFLVQEIVELPVTERQIEREPLIQLRRWQETRGELQCRSPPRLHGAKAILDADPVPGPPCSLRHPSVCLRTPPSPAPKPSPSHPRRPRRSSGSGQRRVGSWTSPQPQIKPLREMHVPHRMHPQRIWPHRSQPPRTWLPRIQHITAPRRA